MFKHCAVINSQGDIEYSTAITDEVCESVARDWCNDHINTCIDGGVSGAGKWIIRVVVVTEISDVNRLVEHCAVLNLGINGDQYFRSLANDSWASLPPDLQDAIEQTEKRLEDEKIEEVSDAPN